MSANFKILLSFQLLHRSFFLEWDFSAKFSKAFGSVVDNTYPLGVLTNFSNV